MPVSLNLPPSGEERLRLRPGFHGPIRGSAARRKARQEIWLEARGREGRMYALLICTSLWGLFWLQFLVGLMYNVPAIYHLSGGIWSAPLPEFFISSNGPLPFSIAGNFVLISVFGSIMALIGGWLWTRGIRCRWRLRLTILGFASWLVAWSLASLAAEDAAWTTLERERARVDEQLTESYRLDERHWLRANRDRIDALLSKKPKSGD